MTSETLPFPETSGRPDSRGMRFASPAARLLLRRHRLLDFDALAACGEPVYQQHHRRSVLRTILQDDDGTPCPVYVKLQQGRLALCPRLTEIREGFARLSLPEREWVGVGKLAELGMNVPQRLAVLREGRFFFRAAVILREVPPPQSVESMLQSGAWWKLSAELRESLLAQMVGTVRAIHRTGYIWHGASSRHFYPRLQPDGTWKLWLIDCEKVHSSVRPRAVERNFRKLFRSMRETGADFRTLDRLHRLITANPAPRGAAPAARRRAA